MRLTAGLFCAALLAATASIAQEPPAADDPATRVFFASGSAELDERGMEELRRWAGEAKSHPGRAIIVTGHTDTTGSSEANRRLSARRAEAIADALVRLGVPDDALLVEGRGESDIAVPTADGIAEPFNRRVEVVLAPARGLPYCPGDPRCRKKPPGR